MLIFRTQGFRFQEFTKQSYILLFLWSTRREIREITGTVREAQLAKKFPNLRNPSSLQCSKEPGNGRYGQPVESSPQSQNPLFKTNVQKRSRKWRKCLLTSPYSSVHLSFSLSASVSTDPTRRIFVKLGIEDL